MSENKILIFIGSCGKSWPYNTTPIQRALALKGSFDYTFFIDKEDSLSTFLQGNSEYIKLNSFKELDVIFSKIAFADKKVTIIHGPSWPISKEILHLRKKYNFKWVIDLYDHENLTSNIYLFKKNYTKFIYHRFFEKNITKAIEKCDVLISAIYENRFLNHKNRVKCINGVAFSEIEKIRDKKDIDVGIESDFIHLGYVGVLSFERSLLILKIVKKLAENNNVKVKFHLIGECDEAFKAEIIKYNNELVKTEFYGFVDWSTAINILNLVDICLYTFPIADRAELDCVYPIKIGEYLALGKHVLSVDSNGLRDILKLIGKDADLVLIDENEIELWVNKIQEKAVIKNNNLEITSLSNSKLAKDNMEWDVLHKLVVESVNK
ncbi:glycosyltransferase [Acinetobacter pittii]|uniref:glycosyltransferase n=1 Tax=Acinetobacter pittii TaxID=48296 RepID=UPI003AA97E95